MSFITPCYNDGDEIERYVNSILDQDYENFELIIVNDGSTDDSKEVTDRLALLDKRIKVIHLKKNMGACYARNKGAKEADGDYYSFLPADSFLYPGVLRTWIEQLDEYKDYDFLYGGYRITDADHQRLPGMDLLFNEFDPYLLETTNYIDGSFPIRAKRFWEIAEIMNKKGKQKSDGLWDPAVKSLNDWDFWLSVVIEGKGKGLYVQDIFFETTQPHAGGLSADSSAHWIERMDQIKKKHDIAIRRKCVASLGASFHAKRLSYILDADFQQMPSRKPNHYDAIYCIGFYPEFAQAQDQIFWNGAVIESGKTSAKKIVHFVGTDIWQLRSISLNGLQIWKDYMRNGVDEVLVEADFTQAEIKEILGIDAKIVPIPPAKLYDIMELPKDFIVAVYMPAVNTAFYRPELMEQLAKEMPDVSFKFFGNPVQLGKHKDIKNIEYMGYITDMEGFIKSCSAIARFPIHDGLPISVLEFMLAGRYATVNIPVLHTYNCPKSDLVSIKDSLVKIQKHIKKDGVNKTASDYWRKELSHDKYRKTMKKIMGYEPKEYWDSRAESWNAQADNMVIEIQDVKEFYNKVKPKTVLDIGCGNGRWIELMKGWGLDLKGYTGMDVSKRLIEICKEKWSDLNFFVGSLEKMKTVKKKYDLIFSYTTLEHVKPEDIKGVIKTLNKTGKQLLLIEPTDFESKYYCHSHNYEELFDVVEKKKLVDKTIYLINLK
ncbi:MAG: glycosyltransferase [Nanoarchaeota archaeon]|nr:glycosyltransferase [Nanoarchaeota archaeon]